MKIGTYYYPEQWPREQWKRDFDNIAAMGLKIVHLAEFAWFTLEPRPGTFQFEWLDECLEMAKARSLDVILCTPTAAPPIWLSQEFPETLQRDEHGTPQRFGGRRHYAPTSPAMRDATTRIVTAMAERYGDHPSVIGWQIDNEYGGDVFDQSPHAHAAFREWLKRKYKSIEELNRAWGCQFWNTYYTSFEQILLPREREVKYDNPHHRLDGQRFASWALADFNKLQADILKPRVGERFVTTNFMPFSLGLNPADTLGDLDLFSWDSYPVSGWGSAHTDELYRIADPAGIAFVHEQMKSYTGRWALMEIQPGQVNWSGIPVLLYPGAVRLWLWTAIAHGAEFITTYRYRQPRFGTELFHHGLVGPDGVTPSAGGREFMQVIKELDSVQNRARRDEHAKPKQSQATIGIVFDFEQLWYFTSLPQTKRWSQSKWLASWYAAAARCGFAVKILRPGQPIGRELSMVIAPGVQMVEPALIEQWDEYAKGGGNLLLTCRTALMDRTGQLWEGPLAAPILEMIGATIEAYDGLPEQTFGEVELDGKRHRWGVWGDLLYAEPRTKVLAKYADQFYVDAAAVTRVHREKGTVTYCGVFADQSFNDALIERLASDADLPIVPLPAHVHWIQRDGLNFLLNYRDKAIEAPAESSARFLIGSRRVGPAGVAIWMD